MLDLDEAQRLILSRVRPGAGVSIPLRDALGRVLAKGIECDIDDPPFDRSMMDGYAVRATDVADAPLVLHVVGQIPAGSEAQRALEPGEAMQINTGAPMPSGADAVVRVEHTEIIDNGAGVRVLEGVSTGKFVTPRATNVRGGQTVLAAGTRLSPLEIGVAAAAGAAELLVYKSPRVAVLVTGDELVDVGQRPVAAQIRNSNEPMLTALIHDAGADPVSLGVVGDDKDELTHRIRAGLESDALCITGGVSMGAFDYVPEVLRECGVRVEFHKLTIKPGRPVLFGTTARGGLVFALPGNPISVLVCFELLVRPALGKMSGAGTVPPQPISARLHGSVSATTSRRSFRPGVARLGDDGQWTVEPLSWRGSGDVYGAATANALIMRAEHSAALSPQDMVSIYLLGAGVGRFAGGPSKERGAG